MNAVIKTGGKQYVVKVGDTLKVEKLDGSVGDNLTLDSVLYIGGDQPKAGSPFVDGASVTAEVVGQGRHAHIRGFTYKAKKRVQRHFGHRQHFTEIKITNIAV
jgi:large subunit ribosomal protein L21